METVAMSELLCPHERSFLDYCPKCAIAGLKKHSTDLKDSGVRRESGTGAVRDRAAGKGRFDLIPLQAEFRIAAQMERGAVKYSARNWEAGMPLSWFADAAKRHIGKYIAGYDDEDHLAAALWNLACMAEGEERIRQGLWPSEMDDLPRTFAGKEPNF